MKTMQNEAQAEKFIVFALADYHLVLPLQEVLQVVNCPTIPDELSKTGLVQIGRHIIRLLDLHQQLKIEDVSHSPTNSPFLIITQSSAGELCAIPVEEPPNLIEFSRETLRSLPQSNPRSGVLRIASYATTLSKDEFAATVFLLDTNRMLASVALRRLPSREEQCD